MQFPDNLKYSKDHEWIRVEGDEAYVGITAFAAGELGDIVFVDVDTEGESLDKDEVFGSVEAVKTVSDLFLPVSGEVLEFNEGLEDAPERGERCTKCFDMRFERTALYAKEQGFSTFTSSLGISRWKDFDQINDCGNRAAQRHNDLTYWTYNWRKRGGAARMYKISKEESFYKQEYCGCVYSLRDTNQWRKKTDRKPIHFGKEFYTN